MMVIKGARSSSLCAFLLVGCQFVAEGTGYPSDTDTDDSTEGDADGTAGGGDSSDDGGGDVSDGEGGSTDGTTGDDSTEGSGGGSGDDSGASSDAGDSDAGDSGDGSSESEDGSGEADSGESGGSESGGGSDSGEDGEDSEEEGDTGEDDDGSEDGEDEDGDSDSGSGDDGDDGDWTDECPEVAEPTSVGVLPKPTLAEVAGLAVSRRHDGVLWAHNDSPDGNLYALGVDGTLKGTFALLGASMRDLEDVAVGPGPDAGVTYVYLGDIGNQNEMAGITQGRTIYRFPEPDLPLVAATPTYIMEYDALGFAYPGGGDENSESLMVDPLSADLYLVRADTSSNQGRPVLKFPFPQQADHVTTLTLAARIDIDGEDITGGDISSRGDQIILRTGTPDGPDPTARIWLRARNQSIADALAGEPCEVPIAASEPMGKAVCFASDGLGYFTASGAGLTDELPIHRYEYKR